MSTIVKSKSRVFGERLNTAELLEALKNPLFSDRSMPVQIYTQFHAGLLKLVYLCPHCDTIHFSGGESTESDSQASTLINSIIEVFIDRTSYGSFVTIDELIQVLETLDTVRYVTLEHTGEEQAYGLTEVSKCDSCDSVHLDCTYDTNCLRLN